ncbi:NACHT domain-containing protein [Saccharothrix variisporea]|uniref:hypothetical protein n=1 Tax=Saccharothrix variisporea TaxID=543527 RepID=UPI0011C49BCF|nr:hypothetical protein [Saccharothrix variisporea]
MGTNNGDVRQQATAWNGAQAVQAGRDATVITHHHESRAWFSRRPDPPAADRLAREVYGQWARAAEERMLTVETLPIRWRRSRLPVAVPVAAATGGGHGRLRFPPLPGATQITETGLRGEEDRTLYDLYAGLPSGRLVITGGAGSGKSAAAILLLLSALAARAEAPEGVPVPVMFPLHGWDPERTPVREWLSHKLVETTPLRSKDVAPLIRDRRIAVLMDGFDEMPKRLRPIALRALSHQADFRLVLLSRAREFADAARHVPLLGAAVVQLDPVGPSDAVDYLLRHVVSPPSPGWRAVAEEVDAKPSSPLARTLRRPLAVTLIRDTYGQLGQVEELLDRKRFPTVERIHGHLLDKVVDVAYTRQPAGPEPRYTANRARQVLGHLARRMAQDGTREFAWWTVHRWVDSPGAVLVRALAVWYATAIVIALPFGLAYWIADGRGFGYGLPVGLSTGFMAGVITMARKIRPRRIIYRWWLGPITARGLLISLPVGAAAAFGAVIVQVGDIRFEWRLALVAVFWLVFGFAGSLFSPVRDDDPYDPIESWRQDTRTGLAFGIMAGFGVAALALLHLGTRFDPGPSEMVAIGLLAGFAGLLSAGPVPTAAWPVFWCQVQLALRHRTPVRLLRFLEDARRRGVLQAVGPVYQFRHAELQDRLAVGGSLDGKRRSTQTRK